MLVQKRKRTEAAENADRLNDEQDDLSSNGAFTAAVACHYPSGSLEDNIFEICVGQDAPLGSACRSDHP
jgi:hypothetical protein